MKRAWLGVLAAVAGCSELPVSPPADPSEAPVGAVASAAIADDPLVNTPEGPRYRSCVHEVPNGARIDLDGVVTRRDGSKFQIPRCGHPVPPGRAVPSTNGWVESARLYTGGYFHQVTANWTVPNAPVGSYNSSQTFFTFPGMQNGSHVIQPVLQYGLSAAGGGSYWTMASWRCGSTSSDCYHSTLVGNVQSGHTMAGTVSASNCYGGQCDWTITTTDASTGASTTYTARDYDNYSDGVGGAMEIWNLGSCNQLPAYGVSYTNVSFLDSGGSPVTPSWYSSYDTSVVPQCGYQVTASGTNVTLADNQVPPPPSPTVTITGPSLVAAGKTCTWSAQASGGTPPYTTYQWQEVQHNTLSPQNGYGQTWSSSVYNWSPTYTMVVVTVYDSGGQSGTAVMQVQNTGGGGSYNSTYCH